MGQNNIYLHLALNFFRGPFNLLISHSFFSFSFGSETIPKTVVMKFFSSQILLFLFLLFAITPFAQQTEAELLSDKTFSGLKLRSIGPSFMSGRIADVVIHPENENIWFVAAGSGGVWKTVNAGITWTPVFDKQPVYSMILVLSPSDEAEKHLQAMEVVFKQLQRDNFRKFLRQAQTVDQIRETVEDAEESGS